MLLRSKYAQKCNNNVFIYAEINDTCKRRRMRMNIVCDFVYSTMENYIFNVCAAMRKTLQL